VFNGKEWRTYGIGDGPLGERVFDIRCSPADGDVWIATSAGLARYRNRSNQWSYYTRLNGLPADQVQCLAFNPQGDVFAGLQCGGVAIARASERHTQWTVSAAPWTFDKEQRTPYPTEPEGEGLPSNLINAVLVTRNGTVWAATTAGLAWSVNGGRRWQYRRGRDFAARAKGVLGGAPKGWKPPAKDVAERLLPEDYVTCLAEASDGTLWTGFREQGCAALDPKTLVVKQWVRPDPKDKAAELKDGYVRRLLPMPDGRILAGGYGGGIVWITPAYSLKTAAFPTEGRPSGDIPPLPAPAAAPDDAQLGRWTAYLRDLEKKPLPPGSAAYLGEDWATQGDWVERYGRRYAMLCAMNSPWDNHFIDSDPEYNIAGMIGPHFNGDDALRHWIHWIKTENPRSLYSPTIAIRCQAEWDDHGEAYPASFDGPDVWSVVKVPAGTQRLSLYFFNKDGHDGRNRCRDYLLEVRNYDSRLPEKLVLNIWKPLRMGLPLDIRSADLTNAIPRPVLARARVHDFWGGVYKTFVVQGPGTFYVRVARQGSHNAIVSAVLTDKMPEPFEEADDPRGATILHFGGVLYAPPDVRTITPKTAPAVAEPLRLWDAAQSICAYQKGADAFAAAQCLAYRAANSRQAPAVLKENWRWHLRLWDGAERGRFYDTMMRAWTVRQNLYAFLRSAEFRPYSPNVVPFSVLKLEEMEEQGVNWRQFIPAGQPDKKGGKQ
jgi:hypothetical protein